MATTSTPQYTVPEDYKSALKDILGESKKIYEQKKAQGYTSYGGPRIAGFTPDELAAMTGIAGLVGAGQQYFDPAKQLTLGQTQKFDAATAQQYMSPYQQAVVDVEKREAIRQAQPQMQDIAAKAATAGGFGGSRQAILEAEAQRNLQGRLSDIQTKGSQAAYETALRSFEAQKERERAAASGLSALGQAAPRQALTELTALSGIGEAQRGMTQAGYDLGYEEFQKQQEYPYNLLGQYQSTVYGYPYQAYAQYQPQARPSAAQNLAGILGAVGKVGSSFGFFNTGGRIAYQSNGGLSGMIKQMAAGSTVGEDTPLGQNITRQDMLAKLLESMTGYQETVGEYGSAAAEALKQKQALAEERKSQLEKSSSPVNYISDLLIGYAAADPEAGLGAQLGSAAAYAEEKKAEVNDEIRQIQEDLAAGRLSQAEANLKIQKAQMEGYSEIADLLETDGGKITEAAIYNAIARRASARYGFQFNPETGEITANGKPLTEDQAKKVEDLILKGMEKYGETGDLTEAQRVIVGSSSIAPQGITTKIDQGVPDESGAGEIAQGIIQNLKDK